MKPAVQTILDQVDLESVCCNKSSLRTLYALRRCRTMAMGYHLFECSTNSCAHQQTFYHSCRNRHCPSCGGSRQQAWVDARMRELVPCKYFHVVFTLPHELNSLVMLQRRFFYDLLFEVSKYTLETVGDNPKYLGAKAGIISVLHTWGQTLSFHPHVHCIVAGGGILKNGKWQVAKKAKYGVLYPIQVLNTIYKARFMKRLREGFAKGEILPTDGLDLKSLLRSIGEKRWNVYAKQPFGGPAQVVAYLGKYTHRVAISNQRILKVRKSGSVVFRYNDYATGKRNQRMELSSEEFIRRFEQHILPDKYCKIRSYGLYANHGRTSRIRDLLQQMGVPPHPEKVSIPWQLRLMEQIGNLAMQCPACKQGTLTLSTTVRGSPLIHAPPSR